ncbi:UNVERIFIED_CONTAM: hypothetical protein FKN15_032105 [Acipenser sinensis]
MRFRHSFATKAEQAGRTHLVQHNIDTGDVVPIKLRPRRMPLAQQPEAPGPAGHCPRLCPSATETEL